MEMPAIFYFLCAGCIIWVTTAIIIAGFARPARGNQISLLDDVAPNPTYTVTQSICPRCGAPIDDTTHTTRHFETTTPAMLKWSETYCGKAPNLNSSRRPA